MAAKMSVFVTSEPDPVQRIAETLTREEAEIVVRARVSKVVSSDGFFPNWPDITKVIAETLSHVEAKFIAEYRVEEAEFVCNVIDAKQQAEDELAEMMTDEQQLEGRESNAREE